jgi:hypothetical protein
MVTVLAISVIIVAIVIILAVVTTSKAYKFKHTVDSIDAIPENQPIDKEKDKHIS